MDWKHFVCCTYMSIHLQMKRLNEGILHDFQQMSILQVATKQVIWLEPFMKYYLCINYYPTNILLEQAKIWCPLYYLSRNYDNLFFYVGWFQSWMYYRDSLAIHIFCLDIQILASMLCASFQWTTYARVCVCVALHKQQLK